VIDQVMKNVSYHDELNHVPHKYNEEADELVKIALGRITIPPNIFTWDVAKPSVDLGSPPSNREEPSRAPSSPAGEEPMDEDPSNETFVLSLLEGCAADGIENMETEPAPARRIGGQNTSPGSIEGTSPQIGLRLGASPGKPSRPLWSTVRCIKHHVRCPAAMHPHSPWSGTHSRHSRGLVWPPCDAAHPHRQRIPPRFYWPTAVADANEVVRTWEGCQFYARKTNLPAQALQTIPVT
jgi:hypothetical protein